ncbi:MAG: metallophosphoesterase, partial [Planctomycetota bacterium]
ILIKGNQCTWWSSVAKVREALDGSIYPLQNNAIKMPDGTEVIGARLWDPPDAPWADERAGKIFERELGRLQLSIDAGEKLAGERTIALIHYPPKYSDGRETRAVPMLKQAGVTHCIYGHLHGKDLKHGFQGEADGIRYILASCDNIGFQPLEIEL